MIIKLASLSCAKRHHLLAADTWLREGLGDDLVKPTLTKEETWYCVYIADLRGKADKEIDEGDIELLMILLNERISLREEERTDNQLIDLCSLGG